jgi:hypothetical protein
VVRDEFKVKAEAFEELLASVRQLGAIRRGERKPSRSRTFKPADVKALPRPDRRDSA